ncbi:FIP1[V]-like protein [Forsythia ovata]|uniref:FIP1[V]-like protein n=1 Tax=Forsythia ovata TaxID=205694 RepID=A0ABD1S1T8_9LAMI
MDYGDFGELESLGSKGELPSTKRSREFEFNANVNMVDPQFKKAPMPGAAHVVPVTIGRGRGDCRPEAIKGAGPMQKGFHPGYSMPAWGANTAGRGFCSGLEFTLPSHNASRFLNALKKIYNLSSKGQSKSFDGHEEIVLVARKSIGQALAASTIYQHDNE